MPRVVLPNYPQVKYTFQDFSNDESELGDYFHYCNAREKTIVQLWQKWNLIHSHCPEKLCTRSGHECVYNKRHDTVQCVYCKTEYPSRPLALKDLEGTHQDLFTRVYYFAAGDSNSEFMQNITSIFQHCFHTFETNCLFF